MTSPGDEPAGLAPTTLVAAAAARSRREHPVVLALVAILGGPVLLVVLFFGAAWWAFRDEVHAQKVNLAAAKSAGAPQGWAPGTARTVCEINIDCDDPMVALDLKAPAGSTTSQACADLVAWIEQPDFLADCSARLAAMQPDEPGSVSKWSHWMSPKGVLDVSANIVDPYYGLSPSAPRGNELPYLEVTITRAFPDDPDTYDTWRRYVETTS